MVVCKEPQKYRLQTQVEAMLATASIGWPRKELRVCSLCAGMDVGHLVWDCIAKVPFQKIKNWQTLKHIKTSLNIVPAWTVSRLALRFVVLTKIHGVLVSSRNLQFIAIHIIVFDVF